MRQIKCNLQFALENVSSPSIQVIFVKYLNAAQRMYVTCRAVCVANNFPIPQRIHIGWLAGA